MRGLMRGTDAWRRPVGGAAVVAAAFWLGWLCGGGGGLEGVAAVQEPSGARQEPPAVAGSPDEEPPPDPEGSPDPEPPAVAGSPDEEPPPDPEGSPDSEPPAVAGSPDEEAPPGLEESPEPGPEAPSEAESPLVQERRREFTAGAGLILNFVRPEGESAFEETMARAAEALAASESDERRRQAEGWSTWRAEEPLADGVILYVSWLDPAVPGADYWIPGILNEAAPTEAQALYETYAESFADGQILLNLVPMAGP